MCLNQEHPQVDFTMTCGRRLDLFVRTMDSFLAKCQDRDLIARWLVSDDRSSEDDLRVMRERYPFLDIEQCPTPGQPASLNRLFARVRTEWFVHWEDDWETVRPGHFIREAVEIARADTRIRNVVFRGWKGPWIKDGTLEYRVHVYNRYCHEIEEALENDWCWFGYSLNPSLQHLPTVRLLGQYDETATNRYFDRAIATRYMEAGLLRANPIPKYVEHIGEENPAWEGYP
jgi:hypothetical protein